MTDSVRLTITSNHLHLDWWRTLTDDQAWVHKGFIAVQADSVAPLLSFSFLGRPCSFLPFWYEWSLITPGFMIILHHCLPFFQKCIDAAKLDLTHWPVPNELSGCSHSARLTQDPTFIHDWNVWVGKAAVSLRDIRCLMNSSNDVLPLSINKPSINPTWLLR